MDWLTGSRGGEVKRLISQLRDPFRREQAASDLVRMGAEAAPALVESLSIRDDPNNPVVGEILARMGPAAIPALARTLQQAHPLLRAQAATILGKTRHRAALPLLLDALAGEFYTVRAAAASRSYHQNESCSASIK